jgi:hypothetical protein
MAYFAQLDENNVVITCHVIYNEECLDENGVEQEALGIQRCRDTVDPDGTFVQTSYNSNIRGLWANNSPAMTYLPDEDIFVLPKPYPSWLRDTGTVVWYAPEPIPGDVKTGPDDDAGKTYFWDEGSVSWVEPEVDLSNVPRDLLHHFPAGETTPLIADVS